MNVRLELFHPQKRLLQQLRCCRQIPVSVGDVAMAETGRQFGQVPFDIDTVAIPAQQRVHGQPMAKVMQARPMRSFGSTQTDLARQLDERPSNRPLGQASAAPGQEETRACGIRAQSLTASRTGLQGVLRCRVERQIARLAELRVANRQHAINEIDVAAIEAQRFVATHAGRRVQAEQCGIGLRPQADRRRQSLRRVDQLGDLFVTIDVWARRPSISVADKAVRRYDVVRVDGAAIACKPTNHCQTVRPLGRLRRCRLQCPGQGDLGADASGARSFGKGNKPLQQPSGETELVAEGAASGQVIIKRILQGVHDDAPGQGSPMARSAAMSTLAWICVVFGWL